jgi:hypothetical protein
MATSDIVKLRIVEETDVFADGSRAVTYRLEAQTTEKPEEWHLLGTSATLPEARKALLFYAPNDGCGLV